RGSGQPQKYQNLEEETHQKQFRITYNADLRTKACDVLRCLLPAATLTNVGLFGNGRFYQGLLTRLYNNALPECDRRAEDAHRELNKIIPKFVKRARKDEYAVARDQAVWQAASDLLSGLQAQPGHRCSLLPM